jgi:hypothetical protein
VDKTEGVIIETIDKIPLTLEELQIPMEMTMGRTPLDIITPQVWYALSVARPATMPINAPQKINCEYSWLR